MPSILARAAATVVLLLATIPGAAGAQLSPDTAARVDSVFSQYDRTGGPGCALGVVRDGELVYARGYGMADLDHGIALSPESVFRLGSVSKQFTGTAAVLAAMDGHLSLDDTVREHVSELPVWADSMTVRQLLHHTSGIRDYIALRALAGRPLKEEPLTVDEMLQLLARQRGLNFAPGTDYLYSNSGYFLVSQIIKRATGRSLREYARAEIFEPLEMDDTHYHNDYTEVVPNRATGYSPRNEGRFRINTTRWNNTGDGGVFSTVRDLVRWVRNFEEPRIGEGKLVERLLTPGVLTNGDTIDYGLGLEHGTHRGLHTVGHSGRWVGYRTYFVRYPEAEFAVICLCNTAEASPERLSRSVAEIFLSHRMEPSVETAHEAGEGAEPPANVDRFVGLYRADDRIYPVYLRFRARGDTLLVDPWDNPTPLRPLGPRRFELRGQGVTYSFSGDSSGVATRVTEIEGSDTVATHVRLEPADYTRSELAGMTGNYYSPELDTSYRLSLEGDQLVVARGSQAPEPVRPGIRDEFRFRYGYRNGVLQIVRDASGSVVGLRVRSGTGQGIRFEHRPDESSASTNQP